MASLKIFIADESIEPAMEVINSIGQGEVEIVFASKMSKAISSVRGTEFALIFIGDKIAGGDIHDLIFEIRTIRRNKSTPVFCIGAHKDRRIRLSGLLRPLGFPVDVTSEPELKSCLNRINNHLDNLAKKYKGE